MAAQFAVDLLFGLKGDGRLKEATQKVQGLSGASAAAQSAVDRLTGSLSKQGASNAQLAGQLRKLKGDYDALTQAAKDSAKAGGAGFDKDTVSRLRGLSTEIGRTREALNNGKTASAGFKGEIERLKLAATGAGRGMKDLGDGAKGATASVSGLGVAIRSVLGPLSLLVGGFAVQKIAADFGDLDTKIRRLGTAGGDSAALSKQLGQIEKELGGVSNKAELAAAAYQSLSAGFSKTADIASIITASTKAAVGGLANQEEVTSVLVKTLNAYGLEASKAAEVTDIISKAVEVGNVEWSDYTQQLGKVSGMAAASGVSFEELNAFIAASTKGGATAEQAFTGLSGVLTGLMQPTKESQEAAALLGVQWNLAGLNAKGLEGLLKDLNKAQAKNPELAARMVGGAESVRGAFAAAGQGGKLFADSLTAIDGAAGKADQDFKTMMKSFANQAKTIDTAFKNLGTAIGEAFGPQILGGMKSFKELLEGITGFIKALPDPVKGAAVELAEFAVKVWAVHAALKAVTGLKALVAATMLSTAGTTAAAGTAAGVATPKLIALGGALRTLAGIGIVTVGIQLVVEEIGKVVADARAIGNSSAAGSTKSLEAQYKGQNSKQLAASRAVATANLTNDRKRLKALRQQQTLMQAQAVSSMDMPAGSDNTELMAIQTRIQTNEKRIAFLNKQTAVAAKQEKATATALDRLKPKGANGVGTNPELIDAFNADRGAKDKAKSDADKLADDMLANARALAENQIAFDQQVYDNKKALEQQIHDFKLRLQQQEASNWVNGFTGAAREQAALVEGLSNKRLEGTERIRELERQIADGEQRLVGLRQQEKIAAMQPATSTATGGSSAGRYVQGGYGPRGPNHYGAHFDIARTNGAYFGRNALDQYVEVNGRALSSGYTVPGPTGGKFGASRDGGTREHRAWDYAFGGGASLGLKNGAKWMSSKPGSYGDNAVFMTPDGQVYRIIHGKFNGSAPALPSAQGVAGPAASSDASGQISAGGDVAAQTLAVQGLKEQLKLAVEQRKLLAGPELTEFTLASTEAFRSQTAELGKQTEAMTLRNRLEMEGVNPAVIEGELQKLAVSQALAERLDVLTKSKEAGKISAEGYATAVKEVTAAANGAAGAIDKMTGAAVAQADPVNALIKQWKKELGDTRGMVASLAGTIESELGSAMSNAVSGVISGTTTVQQAFSQMFKNIGDAFIQMATQMIAKALIMKALGILAGGGGGLFSGNASVSGGSFDGGSFVGGDFTAGGAALDLGGLGGSGALPGLYDGVKFAEGGFVTSTTPAVVGEGGESEYIIPESKMGAAMQRYSAGSRGSGVIPGPGEQGGAGESGGATAIDVSYRVTEVNSVRYVDEATFQAGMRQAAEQGAAAGHRRVFGDLRNSRASRARVGLN